MVGLVEVGASPSQDRRRRVPVSELVRSNRSSLPFDFAAMAATLARSELEAGRLVVAVRLSDGGEALELAHDALITEWKELRDWVDEDRAFRRWHDRLMARVRDTPDDLLSEPALLEADRMLQTERERVDKRVEDFILRSREALRAQAETEASRLRAERNAALRLGSLVLGGTSSTSNSAKRCDDWDVASAGGVAEIGVPG